MRDEETKSLWDHITGECFDGPLAGRRLDFWQVHITNVAAEIAAHPDTILLKSGHQSLRGSIMRMFLGKRMRYTNEGTMLAPNFRSTMHQQIDPRLPEGEQGLGLTKELNQGKFYPVKLILQAVRSKTNGWGAACGSHAMRSMACRSPCGPTPARRRCNCFRAGMAFLSLTRTARYTQDNRRLLRQDRRTSQTADSARPLV